MQCLGCSWKNLFHLFRKRIHFFFTYFLNQNKQFRDLLPTAIPLLCDFYMKGNVKQKPNETNLPQDEVREVMHDVFGKKMVAL